MHAEGLDGLHELVREAARPHWAAGHIGTAVHQAWMAVAGELQRKLGKPGVDGHELVDPLRNRTEPPLWLVDWSSPDAVNTQQGIAALLQGMASLRNSLAHPSSQSVADSPQSAFEALATLSLCARYVERAVNPTAIEQLVDRSALLPPSVAPRVIDELLSGVTRSAWPPVAGRMVDALLESDNPGVDGTRAVYLRLVERDDASAQAAALRCSEILRDVERRNRGVAALSPDVVGWLRPEDRVMIPHLLATELQNGRIEYRAVVRGAAALDAAPALWDDFLPASRLQIVEAIGFGLQNGGWELQAYLTRAVCRLSPLLIGRERNDLARGVARAIVTRNALDAANEVVDAAGALPPAFREQLLDLMQRQKPAAKQEAARRVRVALGGAPAARAS